MEKDREEEEERDGAGNKSSREAWARLLRLFRNVK